MKSNPSYRGSFYTACQNTKKINLMSNKNIFKNAQGESLKTERSPYIKEK